MKKLLSLAVWALSLSLCYSQSMGIFANILRTNLTLSNLPSGTNDIWTVPASYRAQVITVTAKGSTGNVSAVVGMAKISGSYYRLGQNTALTTNGSGTLNFSQFIYEAGETVAVLTSSAGANGRIAVGYFPTNFPARTVRDFAVDNTIRTLYTCPADKVAYSAAVVGSAASWGIGSTTQIAICNESGVNRSYKCWNVLSGGSPDDSNVNTSNLIIGTDSTSVSVVTYFSPGDSFQIQSDAATATQFAWISVLELSTP